MSVTEYFNNNGSTVSLCASEIAKAFDKTNHYALYIKLIKRRFNFFYRNTHELVR